MKRRVIYNEVEMVEGWPEQIERSQRQAYYTANGRHYDRILYGDDDPRWGASPCNNCGVAKGQYHVTGCEYEKCPLCGEAFSGHVCTFDELADQDAATPAEKTMEEIEEKGKRLILILVLLGAVGFALWLKYIGAY
jgi:hypothetical protein